MRAAIIVLCVLLVLPLAAAIEEGVRFEVNGQALEYVSLGSIISGDIIFTPDPEADLVQIVSPNIRGGQATVALRGCEECRATVSIVAENQVTLRFGESIGSEIHQTEATLQFRVDNVPPRVSDVKMGECTSACVYSDAQRTITFALADGESGVDNRSVRITPTSIPFDFEEDCEVALQRYLCSVDLAGRSSQEVVISVNDRAGNEGTGAISARYDGTKPRIIEGPMMVGLGDQAAGGLPVTVRVVVEEPEGANIIIRTPFSNETGTCERINQQDNNYECTVLFTPPNQRATITAQVEVSDLAGNTERRSLPITIYPSDSSTEPNFWSVEATPLTRIDAKTWTIHEKYYPLKLSFEGSPGAVPIQVKVEDCRFPGVTSGGANVVRVDPVVIPEGAGRDTEMQLDMHLAPAGSAVQFEESEAFAGDITCTIRTLTRIGGTIFTIAEEDELVVEPRFSRLPPPKAMIEREEELVAERITDKRSQLAEYELTLRTLQVACGLPSGLAGIAMVLEGGAATAAAVPGGQGVAESLDRAGGASGDASRRATEGLAKLCTWVSCSHLESSPYGAAVSELPGFRAEDDAFRDWAGAIGGTTDPNTLIDPYKSEIVAWGTLCGPAIIYHQQAKAAVDCEYQACLSTAQETGFTREECGFNREFQSCMLSKGGIYNAVPYFNLYETVLSRVQASFSHPLALVGLASSLTCGATIGGQEISVDDMGNLPWFVRIPCRVVQFGQDLERTTGMIQDVRQSIEQGRAIFGEGGDFCEQAQNAAEQVRADRVPFEWGRYCSTGYCTYKYGGEEIVVTGPDNDHVYVVDERAFQTLPAAPDGEHVLNEEIYGGQLRRLDCARYRDLCEEATDAFTEYRNRIGADLNTVQGYDEAMRRADQLSARQNRIRVISADRNEARATLDEGAANLDLGFVPEERREEVREFLDDRALSCVECSVADIRADFIESVTGPIEDEGAYHATLEASERAAAYFDSNVKKLVEQRIEVLEYERQLEDWENGVETEDQCRVAGGTWSDDGCGGLPDDKLSNDELQDLAEEAKEAMQLGVQQLEYSETTGKIRKTVNSMYSYANVGRFFASTGIGPEISWGPYKELKNFMRGTQDVIGELSLEEQIVGGWCEDQSEAPAQKSVYQAAGGVAGARIGAISSYNPEDRTYQYTVETYISVPEQAQGEVRVILKDSGTQELAAWDIAGSIPARVGKDALSHTEDHQYRRACIVFPRPLREYFVDSPGADLDSRELCTDVVEVRE